jgi:hypothetical protein
MAVNFTCPLAANERRDFPAMLFLWISDVPQTDNRFNPGLAAAAGGACL